MQISHGNEKDAKGNTSTFGDWFLIDMESIKTDKTRKPQDNMQRLWVFDFVPHT